MKEDDLSERLQELVDGLASSLGRSVAVDDPDLRLIAHSPHYGDEDPGRLQSLLTRTIAGPLREHVIAQGISSWPKAAYLNPEPSLSMAARLCVPLRAGGVLYGYGWVIDDRTMTAADLHEAEQVGYQMATLLAEREANQRKVETETAHSLRMLITRSADADSAVRDLTVRFRVSREWRIFLLRAGKARPSDSGTLPGSLFYRNAGERLIPALRRAIRPVLGPGPQDNPIWVDYAEDLIILVGCARSFGPGIARAVAAALLDVAPASTLSKAPALPSLRVGVGGPTGLSDSANSFEQAARALLAEPESLDIGLWDRLGSAALLAFLQEGQLGILPDHLLPPLLQRVKKCITAEDAALVALFLDKAGNVARTAESANLHRTTVYNRLQQFEKACAADLGDGETRLLLHLWFRMQDMHRKD